MIHLVDVHARVEKLKDFCPEEIARREREMRETGKVIKREEALKKKRAEKRPMKKRNF